MWKKITAFILIFATILTLATPMVYATETEKTSEESSEEEEFLEDAADEDTDGDSFWDFTEWDDEDEQEKVWNTLSYTEWLEPVYEDDDTVTYTNENNEESTRTKTLADYLTPQDFDVSGYSNTDVDASSLRGLICEIALSAVGINHNYSMGNSSVMGATDCSGFVNAVYRAAYGKYFDGDASNSTHWPKFSGPGHGAATESYDNYCPDELTKIDKSDTAKLKPGDIVVYNINSSGWGHAAIYIGGYTAADGTKYETGKVVQIGSVAGGVSIQDMNYREGGIRCFFSAINKEEGTDYTTEEVKIMATFMVFTKTKFQSNMTKKGCQRLGMTLLNRWTGNERETVHTKLPDKTKDELLASVEEIYDGFGVTILNDDEDPAEQNPFFNHTESYKSEWDTLYNKITKDTYKTYMSYARQILGEDMINVAYNGTLPYITWLPSSVNSKIKPYRDRKIKGYKVKKSTACGVFFTEEVPISDTELSAYLADQD